MTRSVLRPSAIALAFTSALALASNGARADEPTLAAAAPETTTAATTTPAVATATTSATVPSAAPASASPPSSPVSTVSAKAEKSPWSWLGVAGGAVAGLGAGVVSVSTVVLLQESATTDHTKRAIEISIGSACILAGGTAIVVDALTE
jgi:hypothetical protein